MITVKFIGGAKKSFLQDALSINKDDVSLKELLDHILSIKPQNTANLDLANILVAINGIDSSALSGKNTIIKSGDVISIIPVIHGGSPKRLDFVISSKKILLLEIKNTNFDHTFLDSLRLKYPNLIIQAISSDFILGKSHFSKIILVSLTAQKNQTLLSEKLETDILLRFAGTTQISKAINDLGIKKGSDFFLICLGNKKDLDSVCEELSKKLLTIFSRKNEKFLQKYFKITKIHSDSVLSKTQLEDILSEKSAVLF